MLPIPDEQQKTVATGYSQPTEHTKKILAKLAKENRLNMKVLKALAHTGILQGL